MGLLPVIFVYDEFGVFGPHYTVLFGIAFNGIDEH
jgi:hypothetical protein